MAERKIAENTSIRLPNRGGVFKPGQEKKLMKAVEAQNAAAAADETGETSAVDLDYLETKGAVTGFGKAKPETTEEDEEETEVAKKATTTKKTTK